MEKIPGKVFLVGAGPGDAGLITKKGYDCLKTCSCVVYDRLAGEELLELVLPDCQKIYVGKRAGKHEKSQEEINQILVDCAKKHERVVRLKGGDPFVFGRGGEEIEVLQKNGIEFEVIPGITSAVAVPECAGIPVTHRAVSRGFHVLTGHIGKTNPSTGEEPDSLEYLMFRQLAREKDTLVFLMGLGAVERITERLMKEGMPKDTPVAVISEGTTLYEKQVRGTLLDISQRVKMEGMRSPAVIVIGENAKKCYQSGKTTSLRVGIVGTKEFEWRMKQELLQEKIGSVCVCRMEVIWEKEQRKRLSEILQRTKEGQDLSAFSWVIFTSQNAVRLFFALAKEKHTDHRSFAGLKFAVIGNATGEELRKHGFEADFIPEDASVKGFFKELKDQIK